jgi:hypothetical protein
MHTRNKLVLAGLAATLLMAFAVNTATANHLSVSNRFFRIVWNPLTFVSSTGTTVRCPVTLEGSFHERTIGKALGLLLGYVSRAISAETEPPCRGGTATALTATLPWHVTYEGFSGTLPAIRTVRLLLRRVAFKITVLTVTCLYKENGSEQAAVEANVEAGGNITTVTADTTISLPLFEGGIFCPASGGFEGTGEATLLGSTTTRIKLTLI